MSKIVSINGINDGPDADGEEGAMASLRAECAALMEREGLSQADIARRFGISSGTFNLWLNGKYKGDNNKVADKVRKGLASEAASEAVARRLPEDVGFVETPSARDFMTVLRFGRTVQDGIVVISGGAGVGKTMACRAFAAENPNVVHIEITPITASMTGLLKALARRLRLAERGNEAIYQTAGEKLALPGALLILDEAQHLHDNALEMIRGFQAEFAIGVALVGNNLVEDRLGNGRREPAKAQLFSRQGFRASRDKASGEDIDTLLTAHGVTDAPSRKLCRAIAGRPGALRVMVYTLRVAALLASGKGEARAEAHIRQAYASHGARA